MLGKPHKRRFHPHPFSITLHPPLFFVNDSIEKSTRDFHPIRPGRVCVEDDVPIGEVLEGNGLPIHLADGSRTRRARNGLSGVELGKNQALGGSPLDDGTPL